MIPRTIPVLRSRLHELADALLAPWPDTGAIGQELHAIAEETKRRPYHRIAKPRARRLTDKLKAQIRAYAETHPDAHHEFEIARHFGVAGGRVTDAIRGKRGEAP